MAEKFDLSRISSNLVGTPIYKKSFTSNGKLIKDTVKYRKKLWLSFYFALFSTSIFTAILIEESNIAVRIMNKTRKSRMAKRPARSPQVASSDLSSFSITTSPGLFALITTPTGKRAGDTFDGVRYTEAESITMTLHRNLNKQSTTNWSIYAKNPDSGIYNVQFGTKETGEYNFTITTYDTIGIRQMFTGKMYAKEEVPNMYQFSFDKNTSQNNSFSISSLKQK